MFVETDHRVIERGDNKMILGHFQPPHPAYVVAERQSATGPWTVSVVSDNVDGSTQDRTVATRREAVDAMCDMVTEVMPEDGHSIFVPYVRLSDGSVIELRDKP